MKYFIFLSIVLTGCGSMNEPYYNFGLDEIEFQKIPKYNKCDYQKCIYPTATPPPEETIVRRKRK
jgi:hypothetical protein